jgi:hypothetical protein
MEGLRRILSLFQHPVSVDRAGIREDNWWAWWREDRSWSPGERSSANEPVETACCSLKVLGTPGTTLSCALRQSIGSRLILSLSDPIRLGDCVEISWNDALLFGEMVGCWWEDSEPCAAVELEHSLVGVEHLRAICGDSAT